MIIMSVTMPARVLGMKKRTLTKLKKKSTGLRRLNLNAPLNFEDSLLVRNCKDLEKSALKILLNNKNNKINIENVTIIRFLYVECRLFLGPTILDGL